MLKKALNIIAPAMMTLSLKYQFGIDISGVIIIVLYCLLYKIIASLLNKKIDKGIIIISLIFSLNMVIGKYCYLNMYNKNNSFVLGLLNYKNIISIIGLFFIIISVLEYLLTRIKDYKFIKEKNKLNNLLLLLTTFVVIIIMWLPYLMTFFPATMSLDSLGEFKNGLNHNIWHDSQPVIHQLLIMICCEIGKVFSSKIIAPIIVYTIIQYTLLAFVVSYSVIFVYQNINNKKVVLFMILFYGLVPIFGYYSIVMWKDIIYGAFVLLLTIFTYKLITKEKIEKIFYVKYYLVALICLLFRTNAIYMFFLLLITTILLYKNNKIKIVILYLSVIISFYIIKIPIFNHFNIQRSASAEYLAIPLQQIGRMNYKNIKFSSKETKVVNNLIPIEILKEAYDPKTSDGIKFNPNYNGDYFDNNKFKVLSTWFKLCLKHPDVAIESYFISTLGYWYPDLEDRYYENTIIDNDFGLHQIPVNNKLINKYVEVAGDYKNPIIKNLWSIGLYVWLLIISIYLLLKRRANKYLISYIPVIGNLVTLFIATPVFNEVRYVFSLYLCSILLLLIPFFNEKVEKTDKSNK